MKMWFVHYNRGDNRLHPKNKGLAPKGQNPMEITRKLTRGLLTASCKLDNLDGVEIIFVPSGKCQSAKKMIEILKVLACVREFLDGAETIKRFKIRVKHLPFMSNSSKIYAATNAAILRNIPTNATILDIGCGSGYLSQQIKAKGNTVYGLDYTKEAIERAAKRIDHAVVCNIEKEDFPWKQEFDVIVFADILEHLHHPEACIKKSLKLLKKEGIVLISLPNVANWSIRFQLFFGNFTRTETGILDKTHLHFYTLKTAIELIEHSDLEIKKVDFNPNFVMTLVKYVSRLIRKELAITDYEQILESHIYKRYTRFILPFETIFARLWKALFAYQFVFVCHENFRQVPPKSKKARFDRRLQI